MVGDSQRILRFLQSRAAPLWKKNILKNLILANFMKRCYNLKKSLLEGTSVTHWWFPAQAPASTVSNRTMGSRG